MEKEYAPFGSLHGAVNVIVNVTAGNEDEQFAPAVGL